MEAICFEDYEPLIRAEVARAVPLFQSFILVDADDLFGEACYTFCKCLRYWQHRVTDKKHNHKTNPGKGKASNKFSTFLVFCVRARFRENLLRDRMRCLRDGVQGNYSDNEGDNEERPPMRLRPSVPRPERDDLFALTAEQWMEGEDDPVPRSVDLGHALVSRSVDPSSMVLVDGLSERAAAILQTILDPPPEFRKKHVGVNSEKDGKEVTLFAGDRRHYDTQLREFLGLDRGQWDAAASEIASWFEGEPVTSPQQMRVCM